MSYKKEINIRKSLIKLLTSVLFAVIFLMIASFAYQRFVNPNSTSLINLYAFNDEWWFIGYYILIIIIGNYFVS